MSWGAFRLAVIVLELVGVVLLSALLLTPARKHAIVNGLTIAAILRSVCAVIPPIAYLRLSEQFDAIPMHASVQKLCVSMAIVLRYLTVVKAAYSVSFTLPLLYLAIRHSKQAFNAEEPFYMRTLTILCIGPFVWALPAIIIPIPTMVHDKQGLRPIFFEAVCTVSHTVYQIVSLTQMILPLLCATITSLAFVWYLRKSVKLPLASRDLGHLDLTRIIRFGALLGIIILSAVLYAIVMATWARDRVKLHESMPARTVFVISMIWEAITPILMFFIFAAQEEVFVVWQAGFKPLYTQVTGIFHCSHARDSDTSTWNSDDDVRPHRRGRLDRVRSILGPRRSREASSEVHLHRPDLLNDSSMKVHERLPPSLPVHILPMSMPIAIHPALHLATYDDVIDISLRPPPRRIKSRDHSRTEEHSDSRPFKTVLNMPSLTALGSGSDSAGICQGKEKTVRRLDDDEVVHEERGQDVRPNTGMSSQTFGN